MNIIQGQPVITIGVVAGILVAAWSVVVANGVLDGLTTAGRDSITAFVLLLIPVVAAYIASKLVTPLAAPNLPSGTKVNEGNDDVPTTTVE